jgi:RimJ/RimL family protein N-acetyltransferase
MGDCKSSAAENIMIVLETERLGLRHITVDDDAFILELLNDPDWLRFIGDRGVKTLADAHGYILDGPIASYQEFGYGLNIVELKDSRISMGVCGLINREGLEYVDIGFAFLPQFTGQGYAFEAAAAVMSHGRKVLGIQTIVAITSLDNDRSIKLLEKLGLQFQEIIKLADHGAESKLFVSSGSDKIDWMTF